MSKFDAAIKILNSLEFEDYYGDEAKASCRAAIRVLEAAAKVDKLECMKFIGANWSFGDMPEELIGRIVEAKTQVRAILAALPDDTDVKEK